VNGHGDDADAIRARIHEYAFLLDAGDLDGVAALFAHAELRSTRHDRVRRGAAEARGLYESVVIHADGTPRTMHQLTNVTVDVDGDIATARSYFTVLQVTGSGLHPVLAGEYRDRFARIDGRWEYTERVFVPRLFGDLSSHMRSET
jgi:ketosteroid isomerase-like protein